MVGLLEIAAGDIDTSGLDLSTESLPTECVWHVVLENWEETEPIEDVALSVIEEQPSFDDFLNLSKEALSIVNSWLPTGRGNSTGSAGWHTFSRPLPHSELRHIRSTEDVCNILRSWGEDTLADRIAYFASDDDLEEGELPVTFHSALAFLQFFSSVTSKGRVNLACSPEGCISAVWRFSGDQRRASVWFSSLSQTSFVATDSMGKFIDLEGGNNVDSPLLVMEKLIQTGILEWHQEQANSMSSCHPTTLRDIVEGVAWGMMTFPWKRLSYSGMTSASKNSPQIGWSTFTNPIDQFRSVTSDSL